LKTGHPSKSGTDDNTTSYFIDFLFSYAFYCDFNVYKTCYLCLLGKGTYKWKASGCLYDGDWKDDMRNGFGTLSIPTPDGGFQKQYSGGWKDNKKHVSMGDVNLCIESLFVDTAF
jgi:hypothetical protein